MKSFFGSLLGVPYYFESKASEARIVASMQKVGQAITSPPIYATFSRKGYQLNPTVFRCINMISQAVGSVKLEVYNKGDRTKTPLDNSPLKLLLDRPNPMMATASFMEAMTSFYCISGNTYIESVGKSVPLELWPMRPDKMSIVPNALGYPGKYIFKDGGIEKVFEVDFVRLKSPVLHVKTFNPENDWFGQAPLQAGINALDASNEASRWNLSLLQNSATPSGVLQMQVSAANPRGEITEEQYKRMRKDFNENYVGSKRAGTPMLIEGGLKWEQMSMSPKDMDYKATRELSSIEIAMIFGVPLEMLGLGQKTFSNYAEARLAFWQETVLPLLNLFVGELNRWLAPAFGNVEIRPDLDSIEALVQAREQKYATYNTVSFLTINEKREAVGYEPREGWDVFSINNQLVSEPGEFVNGGGFGSVGPTDEQGTGRDSTDNSGDDESGDDDGSEQDDEPADDEDPEDLDDDTKGWKSLNVLNANERRKSWRRQNARRKRLEAPFRRDLALELDDLNEKVARAMETVEPRLLEFAVSQILADEMKDIEKTLKRHIGYTLEDFGSMVFDDAKSQGLTRMEFKANRKYNQYVLKYINDRTAEAIKEIRGTTIKKTRSVIRRLVEENVTEGDTITELANSLRKELNALTPSRALTIARTEVGMASSNGALEAVKSMQIPGLVKEWVAAEDHRTRDGGPTGNGPDHAIMNGAEMPLDEKFGVPPDALMDGPGDPAGGASQVCNCRCVLVFNQRG